MTKERKPAAGYGVRCESKKFRRCVCQDKEGGRDHSVLEKGGGGQEPEQAINKTEYDSHDEREEVREKSEWK